MEKPMTQFRVINLIEIGHKGPTAKGPKPKRGKQKEQLIHLSQGSIDGACGPYSMMMALLICSLIDRDDLVDLNKLDGRTNGPGKLLKRIQNDQGLFRGGTDIFDLMKMLEASYHEKTLKLHPFFDDDPGVDIRKSITEELSKNRPVLLDIDYGINKGHWVVAIGYEQRLDRSEEEPLRFLLLDPNSPPPIISAWNGIVDAYGTKGRYPYVWWGRDSLGEDHPKIKFSCALSFAPQQ